MLSVNLYTDLFLYLRMKRRVYIGFLVISLFLMMLPITNDRHYDPNDKTPHPATYNGSGAKIGLTTFMDVNETYNDVLSPSFFNSSYEGWNVTRSNASISKITFPEAYQYYQLQPNNTNVDSVHITSIPLKSSVYEIGSNFSLPYRANVSHVYLRIRVSVLDIEDIRPINIEIRNDNGTGYPVTDSHICSIPLEDGIVKWSSCNYTYIGWSIYDLVLNGSIAASQSLIEFTFPNQVILEPNTQYWIVVNGTDMDPEDEGCDVYFYDDGIDNTKVVNRTKNTYYEYDDIPSRLDSPNDDMYFDVNYTLVDYFEPDDWNLTINGEYPDANNIVYNITSVDNDTIHYTLNSNHSLRMQLSENVSMYRNDVVIASYTFEQTDPDAMVHWTFGMDVPMTPHGNELRKYQQIASIPEAWQGYTIHSDVDTSDLLNVTHVNYWVDIPNAIDTFVFNTSKAQRGTDILYLVNSSNFVLNDTKLVIEFWKDNTQWVATLDKTLHSGSWSSLRIGNLWQLGTYTVRLKYIDPNRGLIGYKEIRNFVIYDKNSLEFTFIDSAGRYIPNQTFYINGTEYVAEPDGSVIVTDLEYGSYEIAWYDEDGTLHTTNITFNEGDYEKIINAGYRYTFRNIDTTIIVYDLFGNKVEGIELRIDGNSYMTDANGEVTIQLDEGLYNVSAYLNGIYLNYKMINVTYGETNRFVISVDTSKANQTTSPTTFNTKNDSNGSVDGYPYIFPISILGIAYLLRKRR